MLAERFGWTLEEIDAQDEARAMTAVSAVNMVRSYQRVLQAVRAHRPEAATGDDWKVYKMLTEAISDVN